MTSLVPPSLHLCVDSLSLQLRSSPGCSLPPSSPSSPLLTPHSVCSPGSHFCTFLSFFFPFEPLSPAKTVLFSGASSGWDLELHVGGCGSQDQIVHRRKGHTCLTNLPRVLDLAGQSKVGTCIMALRGGEEILAATCLSRLRLWGLVPATLVWKTKQDLVLWNGFEYHIQRDTCWACVEGI